MTTETKVEAVKRYSWNSHHMVEEKMGPWVVHADHQSALDALRGEVERLRTALESLEQAASPMVTNDVQHERIVEKGIRGHTSISIDPFPLMKFRHEDMRDLKHELERARAALTKESP